jgi:hypothetical protein
MEKNMPDDTKAPESQDALSATWDINREFAGAVTLALLLLYHKFMNPFFGRSSPKHGRNGKERFAS